MPSITKQVAQALLETAQNETITLNKQDEFQFNIEMTNTYDFKTYRDHSHELQPEFPSNSNSSANDASSSSLSTKTVDNYSCLTPLESHLFLHILEEHVFHQMI